MVIKLEEQDQGNKYDISRSNTKNNIAIKKNLIEKGFPGEWNGSKPHSYTDTFSLSGFLSDNTYEATAIIIDNIILNNNTNIIILKSNIVINLLTFDVDLLNLVF